MNQLLTLSEAAVKYGPIENGTWEGENKFCSLLEIPEEIGENWINSATGKPVTHIYCNNDMHTPLLGALQNVFYRKLIDILHTFDGCFFIRLVRGSNSTPSWHSYGLAIDLDAKDNAMGSAGVLSPEFVECFTDVGFIWGGNFHTRKDPMHFQWGVG